MEPVLKIMMILNQMCPLFWRWLYIFQLKSASGGSRLNAACGLLLFIWPGSRNRVNLFLLSPRNSLLHEWRWKTSRAHGFQTHDAVQHKTVPKRKLRAISTVRETFEDQTIASRTFSQRWPSSSRPDLLHATLLQHFLSMTHWRKSLWDKKCFC